MTSQEIDDTLDNLCEYPHSSLNTHNQETFKRKREKYKKLLIGGVVPTTSRSTINQPIPYDIGPVTIHKDKSAADLS